MVTDFGELSIGKLITIQHDNTGSLASIPIRTRICQLSSH